MSFKIFNASIVVLCSIAILASAGCGGKKKPDGLPKLVPCSVTVKQEGQPVEGATVSFISESCTWAVAGTTDVNGVAKIFTYGDFPGSPEGSFKVTVQKTKVEGGDVDISTLSPSVAPQGITSYNFVDAQYMSQDTTSLTIDVKGKTTAEFDVGAPIHEPIKAL